MSETLFYCRSCGMVRAAEADSPPWCRHYALDVPARRMVPIPASHPLFAESVEDWREEGRRAAFARLTRDP